MSEQNSQQATSSKRRTVSADKSRRIEEDSPASMQWRILPEIDIERQRFLAEHRAIAPDIEKKIYPLKDIQLNRADVEWLLATHESGGVSGPVDWSDEKQRTRKGLDLRYADLRLADLSSLPLACADL